MAIFPTVAFSAYFLAIFLREYFGNQASLTNCSGTLIRLIDSTASAPPMRRNKGSFQRVSFLIIHMSWVIFYPLIFRDISLKSQELSVLYFVIFKWIILFNLFSLKDLSYYPFVSWIYSFIYSFIFSFIYSFISLLWIFHSYYLSIILSSCLAVYSLKLFSCHYLLLFRIRYFC